MRSFRRNPNLPFKVLCAVFIIAFYFIYSSVAGPDIRVRKQKKPSPIQLASWKNVTSRSEPYKADRVKDAMRHTFRNYKSRAWGYDNIKPVSGGFDNSRNGWGAFIVDTTTTLATLGLWNELKMEVDYITKEIDFSTAEELVDPFETTIRYLGALVSLVELIDNGVVPEDVISGTQRNSILAQAVTLGNKLVPAFDTPTGIPWPRVDFSKDKGVADPPEVAKLHPEKTKYKNPAMGPARAGTAILENYILGKLSKNDNFHAYSLRSWAPLVWNKYIESMPGLVDGPIDINTGAPLGKFKHWDTGHDSYYEYLIKFSVLAPRERYSKTYQSRWLEAALALRHNISSKSTHTENHMMQHLYLGQVHENGEYLNKMGHLACFAPGNLMYGGSHLKRPDLIHLGQALLESCHHLYSSSPNGIGPETFHWVPSTLGQKSHFKPSSPRQEYELSHYGFFVADPKYKLRPEYVESLFYAWRITGEERYREWAWDAFMAFERACKTPYGYAMVKDVMEQPEDLELLDESESFWGAETLKYLYLIFADVDVMSLEEWVFSTEGHPFRRR
ncbi:glycoside hydrolase family 47 protein [Aulographum hederae CBS 113979]|uniref:alpha-1,2-Mannosidase n=1 Tax=Aulographum hederae CBS 113979 TaxID=1176131 RepID=A0A6G1GQU8_9PEZI|nr:glycoside hydrolase family 47 protein [Aulographum hederae CBS 113979]